MKKNKIIYFAENYGFLSIIIGLPIILFIILIILNIYTENSKKRVHWHIPLSYNLCGDTAQLKDNGNHGKIHGHNDNQAHIEGIVDENNRNETLGAFFDSANIVFSETQIGKYKNGDKCEGSTNPGKVSVIINGKENFDYRNYLMNDKDEIKIIFK